MWLGFLLFTLTFCAQDPFPFPHYQDCRNKLEPLLDAIGSLADTLPKDARNFDELFNNDLLFELIEPLSADSAFKFGELLGDLSPERLDQLMAKYKYAHWESLLSGYPHFKKVGKMTKLIKAFSELCVKKKSKKKIALSELAPQSLSIEYVSDGYDFEPFMGEWPMPKSKGTMVGCLHFLRHNSHAPLSIGNAIRAMYCFGNRQVLANSLSFQSHLHGGPIPSLSYDTILLWLEDLQHYSPKIKEIFALIKPYLELTGKPYSFGTKILRWTLLPMLDDMVADPDAYWPASVKDMAINWAKEQQRIIIARLPISAREEKIDFLMAYNDYWQSHHTIDPKDFEVTKLHWNSTLLSLNRDFLLGFVRLWPREQGKPVEAERFVKILRGYFQQCVESMVMSANYRLLDLFVEIFAEQSQMLELLQACKNTEIRRRLWVMLHLNPRIVSYAKGEVLDKNSIQFRDWILVSLECTEHRVADLKLLDYYFCNRIRGVYPGFGLVDMVPKTLSIHLFGLLGNHYQQPPDVENKIFLLSLDPQSSRNE